MTTCALLCTHMQMYVRVCVHACICACVYMRVCVCVCEVRMIYYIECNVVKLGSRRELGGV